MMATWPDSGDLSKQVVDAEHEGDRITHAIVQRLNSTFVTPIDREDIYGLATQMDDIVDYTEEAADFLGLYKIEAPMSQAQELTKVLVAACEQLAAGLEPMVVIRWKDMFAVLENAIDATETAAQILEGIVIKNS
jgi:predicted phosphate transport protein (TIGR00153 family)